MKAKPAAAPPVTDPTPGAAPASVEPAADDASAVPAPVEGDAPSGRDVYAVVDALGRAESEARAQLAARVDALERRTVAPPAPPVASHPAPAPVAPSSRLSPVAIGAALLLLAAVVLALVVKRRRQLADVLPLRSVR